jgi:hypothetical protein
LTADIPVLQAGPSPRIDLDRWRFTIRDERNAEQFGPGPNSSYCQVCGSPSTFTAWRREALALLMLWQTLQRDRELHLLTAVCKLTELVAIASDECGR